MMLRLIRSLVTMAIAVVTGLAPVVYASGKEPRQAILERAQLWKPTDVGTMDLATGPRGPGAFAPGEVVPCLYVARKMSGNTPKFTCRLASGEEVKVKYGGNNGEVYGELLATRLLWALGFGADRMYRVTVMCDGCPAEFGGIAEPNRISRFTPALIERKFAGKEWDDDRPGWAWPELNQVQGAAGGAPREQRDALTLLAVLLQHSDSKAEQQRIVCLGGIEKEGAGKKRCDRPFLLIHDLGVTFGRASKTNGDHESSVNLLAWRTTPVWRDGPACIGNLPRSFTGTLDNPEISEGGRAFLGELLSRLSDKQLYDLFATALVTHRLREPGRALSGFPSVDEWVSAFKDKRQQIVDRRCDVDSRATN